MKIIFTLIAILFTISIFAQSTKETAVVFVACKTGDLFIDGNDIGRIEQNDASKQKLSFGEHYIQLKTATEKINLTIKVDETTSGVTKLGCNSFSVPNSTRLINKELQLSGALGGSREQSIFSLDRNDELIVNCSVLNKNGTIILYIQNKDGTSIFRKEFKELKDEKIKIPSKGIYTIVLYTDALFGKDAKIIVDRVPSAGSSLDFNTSVKRVYDTSFIEVLRTTTRVYSSTNLTHPNRTTLNINLPKNTAYWTYWIGVGQQAQVEMKNFITSVSGIAAHITTNPLALFGLKLIPNLPMFNSTATIDYMFMDTRNGQAFVNNQGYAYYKFKHADNISADYSSIPNNVADLVLAMKNNDSVTGQDVEVRVVAFVVNSKLVGNE